MAFNNGLERKRFEAKQKALRAEYERLGMSEEQIQKLYEYDLADFNSDRRYITHTQPINLADLEADEDASAESGRNPLFEKFREALSVSGSGKLSHSRYGWIEEIDDPKLAEKLKKLSPDDLELLTLLVFDGYSQDEIAAARSVTQQAISKKINRIKKYLNMGL
ncbi:MAG: sigma factor-like helix-turn-helix DNA-binding protein [Eubacteriales bacterium]|nr:sigma factor-like helix-turn-helix DNA-binding protein [Eubacteriales bacterium]